jgi:hypothetical protein
MLHEDLENPDEVEALLPIVQHMRRRSSPEANRQEVTKLLETLLPQMPSAETRLQHWQNLLTSYWPLLLLYSQMRVVRREIWFASVFIMALGTVVTLGTYNPNATSALPLAVVAPFVAAFGVALLYDNDVEQMLEIEDTPPASARLLLLARLTLVFGFDLVLALSASVVLATVQSQISLWPLVMSWLAPMAFLSALAFLLSILLADAIAGAVFSLILWAMNVMLRSIANLNELTQILSFPGLTRPESRPLLFTAAGLLVAVALWLVGKHDRNIGEAE